MHHDEHLRHVLTFRLARRGLLQSGGIVIAGALTAGNAVWPHDVRAALPAAQDEHAPTALTEPEYAALRAVVGRLIPSDTLGPGADEAGVHLFIDRGLAGPYADALPMYQATLAALDAGAGNAGFAAAAPERQDALLAQLETGRLAGAPDGAFPLLLEHTRRGMFGDPVYGGNRGFAGWDLIGYPGIKLLWTEADQAIDAAVNPMHLSVAQFGGSGW